MNPRLTVSVLFVLFAIAAIRPQANDAFKKLKTLQYCWADTAPDRCAEILHRITSLQPCKVGSLSPDGKTIFSSPDDINVPSAREINTQRVTNLIDSHTHSAAFERVRTAVWQIEEVLDLIRTK